MSSAPIAKLWQFDFAGNKFAVFACPVIGATALHAAHFYELILRHRAALYLETE